MDYLEKAERVLDIEIFELKRLRDRLGEDFSRAVELIKETVDARGKVVVVGVGKSARRERSRWSARKLRSFREKAAQCRRLANGVVSPKDKPYLRAAACTHRNPAR